MSHMSDDWFQTNSGRKFSVAEPRVEDIDICDIAHVLAVKPRFMGHLDYQFSIGQHCLVVARLVPQIYALEGLVHDGSEAYVPDVPTPMKRYYPNMRDYEDKVEIVLHKRFYIDFPLTAACKWHIKRADWISVLMEHRLFFSKKLEWTKVPYEEYNIDPTLAEYDPYLWWDVQSLSVEAIRNNYLTAFKYLARERYGRDILLDFFPSLNKVESGEDGD